MSYELEQYAPCEFSNGHETVGIFDPNFDEILIYKEKGNSDVYSVTGKVDGVYQIGRYLRTEWVG